MSNKVGVICLAEPEVPEVLIRQRLAEMLARQTHISYELVSQRMQTHSEPYDFGLIKHEAVLHFAKGGVINDKKGNSSTIDYNTTTADDGTGKEHYTVHNSGKGQPENEHTFDRQNSVQGQGKHETGRHKTIQGMGAGSLQWQDSLHQEEMAECKTCAS